MIHILFIPSTSWFRLPFSLRPLFSLLLLVVFFNANANANDDDDISARLCTDVDPFEQKASKNRRAR